MAQRAIDWETVVRKALVYKGDINAVRRGRVGRRVLRRLYGKATGRLAARLFR